MIKLRLVKYTLSTFMFLISSLSYSLEHKGFSITYNDFRDVESIEYSDAKLKIESNLKNYSDLIYNDINKANDHIYKDFNKSSMRNNSFTLYALDENMSASVAFIRNYKEEMGGCILFFDYDDCLSMKLTESDTYDQINNKFPLKSSSFEIYEFFKHHELAHIYGSDIWFSKLNTEGYNNIHKGNYNSFKSHYFEVYADISAAIDTRASDNLLADIYNIRKYSYFINADTEHYSSPYLTSMLNYDYSIVNDENKHMLIKNIFSNNFNIDYLKYKRKETLDVINDVLYVSKITTNSKIESVKKTSDYIEYKKDY